MMNRLLHFSVLLIAGIGYSLFTYRALMWAVWGAPTHPIQYVALASAVGLLLSAFLTLGFPKTGQWLSIVCGLGIGVYMIPMTQTLVPSATQSVPPIAFLLVGGYFVLLISCLFYPTRKVFSIPVISLCLLTSLGLWSYTLIGRICDGEYRRPAITYFELKPSDAALHLSYSTEPQWLPQNILSALSSQGIEGTLVWQGSWDSGANATKMFVISSGPIPEDKDLNYPKDDYIIYIFDGIGWKTFPKDAEVYPSFATLKEDGMLNQKTVSGGIQGTSAFQW